MNPIIPETVDSCRSKVFRDLAEEHSRSEKRGVGGLKPQV